MDECLSPGFDVWSRPNEVCRLRDRLICKIPANDIRVGITFKNQCIRRNNISFARFAERQNTQNCLRFEQHSKLRFVVERSLQAAHVEVNPHAPTLSWTWYDSQQIYPRQFVWRVPRLAPLGSPDVSRIKSHPASSRDSLGRCRRGRRRFAGALSFLPPSTRRDRSCGSVCVRVPRGRG